MIRPISALCLALAAGPALAGATPEGAARISASLRIWFGSLPGVVSVVPAGESYTLTLDPAPLAALVPAGASASATPLVYSLTDRGDGTWGVTQDQPLRARLDAGAAGGMEISADSIVCEGIFDTALMAFAGNACRLTGIAMEQRTPVPDGAPVAVSYRAAAMEYASTSVAAAGGAGVDTTMSYTLSDLAESFDLPAGPGAAPQKIELTAERYAVAGTVAGARSQALMGLVAWAVAHPSAAAMDADRAGAKAAIAAALPFFDLVRASGTVTGIAARSPFGEFALAEAAIDVELTGAVPAARFREALRLKGLTLPAGLLPPFAEPLLPQGLTVDFAVDGFDGAAAAQVLTGLLDLAPGQEPGPEVPGALAAAALPAGKVTVTLAPGELANAMYLLTWQGAMEVGPAVPPTGSGKVVARGLDAVIATLDAAPPEIAAGILPVLGMARGIARPGVDGALEWEIDATEPGTLKVNGVDLRDMQ